MSYRRPASSNTFSENLQLSLQPALAWLSILGLAILTVLGILTGAGQVLNLAFPVGALAVGALLYFRYPILYVGFTWWLWFLTPFVRRLSDYHSSFTDPSPILLTPYLVSCVTLVTLWQNLPKLHRQGSLPFILAMIGIFYGFLVGLINRSPIAVGIGLMDWLAPVLFGYHIFVNWRSYPAYLRNIQRIFLWGMLIMGIYGVIQYLIAPEWDRFWLTNVIELTGGNSFFGSPEPRGIRVFSTMHSSEPFGSFLAAALLFLLNGQGPLNRSALAIGHLALLLTTVRSAWLGWLTGLLVLMTSLKEKYQIRLVIIVVVMSLLIIPLAMVEPFASAIGARITSLSDLGSDHSANARISLYRETIDQALTSLLGQGIGGSNIDSAILYTLLHLGWFGTIFYWGGTFLIVFSLFKSSPTSSDQLSGTFRAMIITALIRLPLNLPMIGSSGVVLWGILGLSMAARVYHSASLGYTDTSSHEQTRS